MLKRFKAMRGSIFNADRAYDAETIFKHIYKLGMKPKIKQRNMLKGRLGKRHKYRMKASKEFDEQTYHHRGLIEATFGAEESNNHKLKTRFRTKEHQEKWGQKNSNRMEPQNTKQNKMHKTTKK